MPRRFASEVTASIRPDLGKSAMRVDSFPGRWLRPPAWHHATGRPDQSRCRAYRYLPYAQRTELPVVRRGAAAGPELVHHVLHTRDALRGPPSAPRAGDLRGEPDAGA